MKAELEAIKVCRQLVAYIEGCSAYESVPKHIYNLAKKVLVKEKKEAWR